MPCARCGDCLNTLLKELGIGAHQLDFVNSGFLAFISISQKKKKKRAIDKDMNYPSVKGPGVTAEVCNLSIIVAYSHSNTILLSHWFVRWTSTNKKM